MAEWLNSAHTAVITGATGVIGAEIARGVVATGATVILAVRDTTKGQALAASLTESTGNTRVSVEPVDFDSLRSVARLAEAVGTKHGGSLHLLVNCVATVPKDRELTTDGLERQFAVNALSYFATMTAFHPLLAAGAAELSAAAAAGTAGATTARARVVNVAAFFAGDVDFRDLEFTSRPYQALRGFKQSKALVRLLTGAAARKYKRDGIAVSCCHPGVTRSPVLAGLGYRAAGQNPSAAAATPLQLCLGAEAVSGEYFRDGTLDTSDEYCANEADGEVAWRLCEDKLGGVDATSKA